MNIQTAYFGEININASDILHFEFGIPGFEKEKQFILLPLENNSAFNVLQSVQKEALAFIVTPPAYVLLNYPIDLDEATVQALNIEEEQQVSLFAIVSLKDTLAQSTVNLKAPIVINTSNNKAKQLILDNEEFEIRHPMSVEGIKG